MLLLLALWLPATCHCQLEVVTGLQFLKCCTHQHTAPHQDADCDSDGCAVIESGGYMLEANPSPTGPPLLDLVVEALDRLAEENLPTPPPALTAPFAPPELPKIWQFSCRAALPPRAPSFLA